VAEPSTFDALVVGVRAAWDRERRGRFTAKDRAALRAQLADARLTRRERDELVICAGLGDGWDVHPVLAVLDDLLAAGGDPNAKTNGHRMYPYPRGVPCLEALMRALRHRDGTRARDPNRQIEAGAIALVRAGASTAGFGPAKLAPIHRAAEHGLVKLIAALVEASADVDVRDKAGETALFYAARGNRIDAARALVDAGATNARNRHGETAYDIAVAFGSTAAAHWLATRFPRPRTRMQSSTGLSDADVTRLLARVASSRHSIMSPWGAPDRAVPAVFAGGAVTPGRVTIRIDARKLPKLSPTVRAQLLIALGHEAMRWLNTNGVETRAFSVGGPSPWFMIMAKSAPRAQKLVATIRDT
jgi:Ankyrin repeats (3 copies)